MRVILIMLFLKKTLYSSLAQFAVLKCVELQFPKRLDGSKYWKLIYRLDFIQYQ